MNRRWLWILIGVIAFFVVLFSGAVAGAGLTYLALQARPIQAAREIFFGSSSQADYEAGVLILHVEQGSPAADAGLRRGDIILSVDGQEIETDAELIQAIDGKSPGDEVILTVQQCESTQDVTVQLEDRNGHIYLGLQPGRSQIFPLRPSTSGDSALQEVNPAFAITNVVTGSPADEAGLSRGEVIVAIDGQGFQSADDLAAIIHDHQPGDEITLSVWSPSADEAQTVDVTLGENPQQGSQAYLGIEYLAVPDFTEAWFGDNGFFRFELPESQGENVPLPQLPSDIMPFMHDFLNLPEGVEGAVVVTSVVEHSAAEKAGLQAGDLITAIDGEQISSTNSLADAIHSKDPGDAVSLTVYRVGEAEALEVEAILGEDPDVEGQAYLGVSISGFMLFQQMDPSQDQQNPFHFEFQFPWQNENPPNLDSIPGEEA